MRKPVVLLIRDGWGFRKERYCNAIAKAKTPNIDHYLKNYSSALLDASGPAVGIPEGFMGNSEVGHMTIGAGRIIKEEILRINEDINTGKFYENKAFINLIDKVKKQNKALHLLGLLSDKGVHSHIDHLIALIRLAEKKGLKDIIVHPITDGRDSPPKSALDYLGKISDLFKELGVGRFGVIMGRYFAMDRDKRWVRTELAYHALTQGKGEFFENYVDAIKSSYKEGKTDEFIRPRILGNYKGFSNNDGLIFFNFRFDRTRQLTKALLEKDFDEFHTVHEKINLVTMTQYYKGIECDVAYPPHELKNLLADIISRNKLNQLRISETEKYAHVTFFFNGLVDKPKQYEERILIDSPKVATYDLKPEMSVYEITDRLETELDKSKHDFIVVNLVNGDMVGHTGQIDKAVKAVEAVDECCKRITEKTLEKKGTVLITADHGNCEHMSGNYKTSHTTNPVHLILVTKDGKLKFSKKKGGLSNIAPTVLKLLDIEKPNEMTSNSLI